MTFNRLLRFVVFFYKCRVRDLRLPSMMLLKFTSLIKLLFFFFFWTCCNAVTIGIGMESQDPIEHSLDRLNLGDNQKLKERAQFFYHQCSKVPPKMFLKGINSKPTISIHLACER